ncbi:MAG: cob(I)yrinic acid a,c-diamide adenosyltransferase [Candidatus Liptonbacteria bacterium]|nr:cob(I)yrinic acid a,c-diamide adenosyltransferase [Candidatus Liptonbacteria bacterium]
MIIVFTGDGKGKTTASLGQAMRSVGRGKKVLMIQFIKGPWRSGEDEFVKKLKELKIENWELEIRKMGLGFVGILGDKLPREDHAKAARLALQHFIEELPKRDMVILDEVNVAVSLGLLSAAEVLESLRDLPKEKMVILTGRGAPQEFIDAADLVTEMREIKHPYNYGEPAEPGVEF